ncbi:LDL receptor repeat-containing protein egg-2 [Lingula anatina]|uniref:LDL receptor repeat-containing protein egg-2 n=1 Tax=Lingula anatina TaxID=7574 RepID=A0A1S3HAJ4_LINAN|nr:LDL receptor repeat-containing protein egg-2 [Lingula anatina]|eukprot:XP_013383095.1 LDL receptor repeat-containing protein egg-2 [Lingula anatina]
MGKWCSYTILAVLIVFIATVLHTGVCQDPPNFCDYTKFICGNLRCINKDLLCNGIDDCGDGSDEGPRAKCRRRCFFCLDCEFTYSVIKLCDSGCQKVVQEENGKYTVSRDCAFTSRGNNRCDEQWQGNQKVTKCTCTTDECNGASSATFSFGLSVLCISLAKLFS